MLIYLIKKFRFLLLIAAMSSVISGVCGVLLLTLINQALTASSVERESLIWSFAFTALGLLLSGICSTIIFERLRQAAHADLRRYISSRVMATEYAQLERIGSAKVQSALSEHSVNVAEFFVSFPAILTNGVIVIGCLLYLAVLSWKVFLMALVVLGIGSLGYHLAHLKAIHHLDDASKEQDRLFAHFRALVDGAKELRLHRSKRQEFSENVLNASIDHVRDKRIRGMSIFMLATNWGNFLIYAFIGLTLFLLVGDTVGRDKVVTGFALVFVYMITPLEMLLVSIPRANLAQVSANRIDEATREMTVTNHSGDFQGLNAQPFQSLVLKQLVHRYYHERSDDFFSLGPINLSFEPGQVTFLVGGNGSGKTTLAKLLVGLYTPESGEIFLNGQRVVDTNRDDYRQIFSTVFFDFYLFEQLLDSANKDLDEQGNALLDKLNLQNKVQVIDGAFSTQNLSQGQRKRLALVVASLEDRPFMVFDEWAADQDPSFKEVFYHEILPQLRDSGKTVLVISHDDRYFDLADRLIKMENGKIVIHEKQESAIFA